MSLAAILPAPRHVTPTIVVAEPEAPVEKRFEPPHYGQRKGFVPRSVEDFGDGGAFPEILMTQYPLDMGRKDKPAQQAIAPLTVSAHGKVQYDMILRQGSRKDVIMYSQYGDMIEKDVDEESLVKPSAEEEAKISEKTRAALMKIVDNKVAAAQPTHVSKQESKDPVFIRYTPSSSSENHNSGAKQRLIRLQEMPVDPLDPPKFKHTKAPPSAPSPPAPVMHSPPRKLTAEDQANWKIPPCISNWKNIKGYTIPLDKRLAADGRGIQEVQVNDKFAKLSEALFLAERNARTEIEARSAVQRKIEKKKKEAKEEELRVLAAKARKLNASSLDDREEESFESVQEQARQQKEREEQEEEEEEENENEKEKEERDNLRKERKREIRREMRMENKKDLKKTAKVAERDRDRDVSEKIALGQQVPLTKDAAFDQRLFNQSEGVSGGFGNDESYNLYDKPLFSGSSANMIYRPKAVDEDYEAGAADVMKMIEKSTKKFVPDRGFEGAEMRTGNRDKPVEFEKHQEKAAESFAMDRRRSRSRDRDRQRSRHSRSRSRSRDSKRRRR